MNAKLKGYILGAVAAATYGTNPLFALPLYSNGMTADSVLFYRYLLAIPAIAAMLIWRRRGFALERASIFPMIVMGLLMALSSVLLFESYTYMDAGIASTLLFVYPLMVAVIMVLVFKERLTLLTFMCILLSLAGIGLLFKGSDGTTLSIAGTGMVMLASLCYACYIVGMNRPGLKSIPTLKVIFYVLLCGVALFSAKIAFTPGETFSGPQHPLMWLCIAGLALLPTVVSFICTTAAIQYIGPTPTAILGALEPATAVFFGVTVFGEVMTPRDWMGLCLIVLSVSIVVSGGSFSNTLVRFRRMFPSLRHHKKA